MEYNDYFSGAIRFNTVILFIDIILMFQFFFSWYLSYKRTGWAIDPWNLGLLLSYFFPFLLLYPFSSAIPNVFAVGAHVHDIQRSINEAYLVSLTGYMSFFAGSIVFKRIKFNTPLYWLFILPIRNTLGKAYKGVILNKDICKIVFFIYCGVLTAMLLVAFKAGSFNNPRAYFYKNESIRVFYNFTVSLSSIVSGIIIARIFQFNQLSDKVYLGLFIFVNLFIGSRSFALGPLVGVFTLVVFLVWKGRLKFRQMIGYAAVILALVVILGQFRSGKTDEKPKTETNNKFFTEILYGNSFSDLRDFAWCLSAWDGKYYYGKTYLSAFMSFIPTTYSSFRNDYNIGRITAKLGGFNPKDHPGLRPGTYGESYLNFGIVGVMFVGLILGYTARYMDYKAKVAANTNNKLEYFVSGVGTMFVGNLGITSGFFTIYTFLVVIVSLYILKLFIRSFIALRIYATS
jgi:oligosaccharide repeat unit polymerase